MYIFTTTSHVVCLQGYDPSGSGLSIRQISGNPGWIWSTEYPKRHRVVTPQQFSLSQYILACSLPPRIAGIWLWRFSSLLQWPRQSCTSRLPVAYPPTSSSRQGPSICRWRWQRHLGCSVEPLLLDTPVLRSCKSGRQSSNHIGKNSTVANGAQSRHTRFHHQSTWVLPVQVGVQQVHILSRISAPIVDNVVPH